MRIGIIAPPWVPVPPPSYGGTEVVLDVLARGLQAAGHDVLLFTTGDSSCDVPIAFEYARSIGTVDTSAAKELCHVIAAYDHLLAWHPDVIHDHTLCGPVYARRFGVPLVTTNHGPFDGELGPLYRTISTDVAVLAISRHQASRATGTRIAGVIHHGLDIDAVPHGHGDGGYLAFVGRMSPDKGVDVAARVARAAGRPLKIAAKMAEPAEVRYFHTVLEPLLGDGIEYVGELGAAAKWDLIGGASCLLNPVRWAEPFGMVMIEALACGTPVIATPVGAVPEIVDDGVTGFVRHDEAALVEAVRLLPALDRQACRRAAADRFCAERMVDDHVRVFQRVVRGHVRIA